MKVKDIKAKLNKELDNITPDVYTNVVKASSLQKSVKKSKNKINIKRFSVAMVSCCLVIALIIAGVALWPKDNPVVPTVEANATYMTIDINPSLEIVADSNNKIVAVRANNEDGEILLASINSDTQIIGKDITVSAKTIIEKAALLGYIDVTATAETPSAVKISAINYKNQSTDILTNVRAELTGYFKSKGIFAVVSSSELTKEQLIEKINGFDKTATSDMAIEQLNANFVNRQVYYEEEVTKLLKNNSEKTAISIIYKKEYISDFIDLLEDRYEALTELDEINNEIAEESESGLDGWAIRNNPLIDFSDNKDLIEEFNEAYDKCIKLFNKTSLTKSEFELLKNTYKFIDFDKLEDAFDNLEDNIIEIDTKLNDLMQSIKLILGGSDELEQKLENIPQDIESYATQVKQNITLKCNERSSRYFEQYNKPRENISDDDYDNFIQNILNTYGSLENYFNSKAKTTK